MLLSGRIEWNIKIEEECGDGHGSGAGESMIMKQIRMAITSHDGNDDDEYRKRMTDGHIMFIS